MLQRETDCGPFLKQIHDSLDKGANNSLRALALTSAQFNLLFMLANAEGGTYTLKELEKRLHVSQATTAGVVKRLEQKGFIESFTDANDKRVKNAKITAAGIAVCVKGRAHIDISEQRLVNALTDVERLVFRELLKKIADNIN
jgi:DNA-binding MarR family transcriptional regulator